MLKLVLKMVKDSAETTARRSVHPSGTIERPAGGRAQTGFADHHGWEDGHHQQ